MIQRWWTTRSLIGPASSTIPASAATATVPSNTSAGTRNRNVLTSATAATKRG